MLSVMTNTSGNQAVFIGGSAGGIRALSEIIENIPANFVTPIVVVQHLPKRPTVPLQELVSNWTSKQVIEIEAGCQIEEGKIYIGPPDYHLLIETDGSFSLSVDDPVQWSRPSIDVLFESAAYSYRNQAIAVVLSGANQDGAQGARKIYENGGVVIVQDPETADVATMPLAALAQVPTAGKLSPISIARYLSQEISEKN